LMIVFILYMLLPICYGKNSGRQPDRSGMTVFI
jgi:hypothetical protein